jgi:hypothetical protein
MIRSGFDHRKKIDWQIERHREEPRKRKNLLGKP